MSKLLLPLLILAATCQLAAQDLLTVRVGVFRDVKASEFAALKPLGFVYGIPSANNTTEVFVGHYNEQDKAVNIASNLQQQGYRNAQAFQLPVNTAPANYYIQLSLHSGSRPVEWPALERAGKLFVASTDGMSKIMTGPYPDAAAANNALPVIKSLGYRDAFIKQVDPARLITIGTFETGIKKPLIPINLQDTPPTTTVPALDPAPQAVNTPLSPAPGTYGSSPAPATAPPTTPSPNLTTTGLNAVTQGPSIDGRTIRSCAAELQRVLKEKGYYESTIDGYYGPGTTAAYETAWAG
ncbi:MAG: peptidoglycan-binding protein, partial [Bacteroidota bacterium]